MTPLDDLAFFQQLARCGSLTATAQELGMSLSAVSKRLKQLEARLGVELASRTTRRLTLTAEGELYRRRGAAILDDLGELEGTLSTRQAVLSGQLRINATFGFGRRHVAPLISRFTAEHPRLEVLLELTNFPLNLADHGFDVGIRVGPPPDARVVARRVLANRRVLCAAPSYLAHRAAPAHPRELAGHDCLVVRENDSGYALWRFDRGDETAAIKVGGRLASNDAEVVTRLALDGHGVMLRSWWDVYPYLQRGELQALLPDWHGVAADFYAVYEPRRHLPARLRAFIAYLEDNLPGRVPPQDVGSPKAGKHGSA
ncbi:MULTISPECIES: LysR family transcriptional regulator [Halomonadaceae]|uniref:LysR substrate-binding domain-containing protein n=1 Tax=Modicisalibacter zincidurans TaxID=1178777 RepID=A0ABP9RDW1_9GAMM|nr:MULTISPECIES: LysR family transcriptional regulator [Halomonas]MCD6007574.1 LysR family transcriptional regulator [Halomonas sp. IOP_31]MEA3251318.1 LysR family transcriptional regulator [Pseudomonadota bacterium]